MMLPLERVSLAQVATRTMWPVRRATTTIELRNYHASIIARNGKDKTPDKASGLTSYDAYDSRRELEALVHNIMTELTKDETVETINGKPSRKRVGRESTDSAPSKDVRPSKSQHRSVRTVFIYHEWPY